MVTPHQPAPDQQQNFPHTTYAAQMPLSQGAGPGCGTSSGQLPAPPQSSAPSQQPSGSTSHPFMDDEGYWSQTSSDTSSDSCAEPFNPPAAWQDMSQQDALMCAFTSYTKATRLWRRMSEKPTRRTRRVLKRIGKHKGRHHPTPNRKRYFQELLHDTDVQAYFTGKGDIWGTHEY